MGSSVFLRSGIRDIRFSLEPDAISFLKSSWQDHLESLPTYPTGKFSGKGIVMCAGGIRYFTCAWVAIKTLRRLGCTLPVELWFLKNELSDEVIEQFKTLNVVCKNFLNYVDTKLTGVKLKPLAILHSQFEEILFLDADNNCLIDPGFLFETDEYLTKGAVFWPDYWKTAVDNPIWQIVDNEDYTIFEQESGQILINKQKCWQELNICLFFNENHSVYHELLFGDKDTFKFAWAALKSAFHMIKKEPATCGFKNAKQHFVGTTMIQHKADGMPLFLHKNLLKWDLIKPNERLWTRIREFDLEATKKEYILNGYSLDLKGEVIEYDVPSSITNLETICLEILDDLRNESFYSRFMIYAHINAGRSHLPI